MLSVTTHITTDIAPVPLLWVIPLTIYLVTFVLAFSPRTAVIRRFAWYALPFVVLIPVMAVLSGIIEPPGFMLLHLAVFFIAAMACHGELAASRPDVSRLTEFYVWLAVGGAIGGLFNVVIAPVIFRTQVEYPLGLIVACLLLPSGAKSPTTLRVRLTDVAIAMSLGVIALVAHLFIQFFSMPRGTIAFIVYVFAVPGVIALFFFRRPLRFALSIAAIWVATLVFPDSTQSVVAIERSFFGVHKIVDRGAYRVLLHGNTHHGAQSLRPDLRCTPLSYYYPTGPLGEMFATLPNRKSNIAVVGLGTGSTSGYARPGQVWTFYEIDPQMERIARNPRYFTFLRDCAPQARVVLGDARLSLTSEPDSTHDVLIIDAFSSDAIPVHLLTREAMSVYTRKLAPRGVIAFHISNRYVNLRRVLARLARDAHLVAYVREDRNVSPLETYEGKLPSVWVMMARTAPDLGSLALNPRRWTPFPSDVTGPSWTDNYSNVLETLKLHI
jgi:hypothetical protein